MICSQLLEDWYSSVNQRLLNDQYMILKNHAHTKDSFNVQDKPIDFFRMEYICDMFSEPTLQLTCCCKKPLLLGFGIVSKKIIYSSLERLLKYYSIFKLYNYVRQVFNLSLN